jgi:dolichol-phosphate mannosyltransferase
MHDPEHEASPEIPGIPAYEATRLATTEHRDFLVIPVINEGQRILDQLAAVQGADLPVHVVLADGGSTDGSTEPGRLTELGLNTLLVKTGPGRLSAQLRMGFDYALRNAAQSVVTVDGNGKDDVTGAIRILAALHGGLDFVQGSRYVPGGVAENTPWVRDLAIRAVHAPITSVAARTRYTDTTNGFRGHSRRLLTDPRVAPFRGVFDTYELLAYLPIRASRLGLRTGEVPVRRSYPDDGAVPTKIHGMSGNLALLRILGRAASGRFTPTPAEQQYAASLSADRYNG